MMQCFLLPAMWSFFFFNDTATTEIYTLSLHDALPIWPEARLLHAHVCAALCRLQRPSNDGLQSPRRLIARRDRKSTRLNSSHSQISYAVFCLKKKKTLGSISRVVLIIVGSDTVC